MDKKYIKLFKDLAQATAATAEMVMDYDSSKGDAKGLETATSMRDDYQALAESLDNLMQDYQLNRNDAAKLLVGAMIQVNQIQDRINNLKKAMAGYQTDVIPKLQAVIDNSKTDEEAFKIANEKFVIENNN